MTMQRWFMIGTSILAVGTAISFSTFPKKVVGLDEVDIELRDLPPAVQRTIGEHLEDLEIVRIECLHDGDQVVYEIVTENQGGQFEFAVDKDGIYLGAESETKNVEDEDKEEALTIRFADAPLPVRDSFQKFARGAEATKSQRLVDQGVIAYEFDFEEEARIMSVTITEAGEVLVFESRMNPSDLPEAIRRAITKDFSGGSIVGSEIVQMFLYELEIEVEGETYEVFAYATGQLADAKIKDDDDP